MTSSSQLNSSHPEPTASLSQSSSSYATVLNSLIPPSTTHIPLSLPTSPTRLHIPSSQISSLSLHPVLEATLHILNLDLPSAHFLARHMQSSPRWEGMYVHALLHRIEGDIENARAWYSDIAGTKDEEQNSEGLDEKEKFGGRKLMAHVWGFDSNASVDEDEKKSINSSRDGHRNGHHHGTNNNNNINNNTDGSTNSSNTSSTAETEMTKLQMQKLQVWRFLDRFAKFKNSKLGKNGKFANVLREEHETSNKIGNDTKAKKYEAVETENIKELLDLSRTSLIEIRRFLKYCEGKYGTRSYSVEKVQREVWISMAEKHGDQAAKMITGGEGWREF